MLLIQINKGDKYGKLSILKQVNNTPRKFLCRCECGNTHTAYLGHLKSGAIQSCGCIRGTHNMTKTKFYTTYTNIKTRCYNTKGTHYKNYGGRGIKCKWKTFEEFKNDMYEDYLIHFKENNGNTTIERINVNGNYCKDNCCWITQQEQYNNKTNSILIEYNGSTRTLKQWSIFLNKSYYVLYERIIIRGMSFEYAIHKRIGKNIILFKGKEVEISQLAKQYGIPYKKLWSRLFTYKWDLERALKY